MSQDNIYTRITVQKAIELDTITPLSAGQYPKFVVNLSKSILGVTSEELGEAVNKTEAAANKAATAEKNAKASEINAKASETSASSSKAAALASQNAAKASETNAKNSENAAKVSQSAAKTSETNAKNSENAAKTSQTAAAASQNAAKGSADAAKASQTAASASQNAAKTSETNSKKSEDASAESQVAAKSSETAAAGSQVAAKSSETAAKASQSAAKASEGAAKVSETNAKASADNSKVSQADAKASADAAKISQNAAKASETNSKNSENAAKASQTAAASSQSAAKASETNAKASADAAKAVEVIASGTQEAIKTSEANAKAAAEAAKASQTSASASQSAAKASESAAKTSQTAAASSQSAAKTSETNSKNSENAAKASQTATASSQSAAKASETNAKASEVSAKTSETNTMNALSKYIKIGTSGENVAFNYPSGKHGYFTWKEGGVRSAFIGFPSDGNKNLNISNENGGDVLVGTGSNKQLKVNGTPVVKQGDDGFHGGPSKIESNNEEDFLSKVRSGTQSTLVFRNARGGIPGVPQYSPTLLLKAADTWATLSVNYETGRLSTRAGNTSGSKNSPPKLIAFTDEVYDKSFSDGRYLRTPNSKAAIGVEQWKVGITSQYAKWLKIATIGGVDASAQGSRYSFELNSIVDGYGTDAIQSIGTLVVTITNGASAKNISAKLFRTYRTANDSRIRVKQLGRYRAELWIRIGGYGSVQASCLSMDKYEPASNVLADDIPIGGTGDLLTYDTRVSEIYNSDNISEIVSRITTNKQTIKSELGATKFSLTSDLGGDTGGLTGKIQGGSWASWPTRPAMLDVQATINNGASSIWKLRSPTGEVVAALGGYSTNGTATGATLQLRWGPNGITYNSYNVAASCDIVTDKLFRGNQTVLSGDGGVRAYFVSSSDNSNYFAFHNKGGTDISSRTAFIGFGSNDTTSFTIRNDKADKYLAIGNTLTFNGTQVLDKSHITQTFGVQTDLVPSVKIVKDGLDNRYSKSESDARFVNTNETNLGKTATALTTIPSGGWGKPVGYSVMVNQASTGKPPNTTNHGYWHVIAARDTAGGYAGFYTDYVDGRVFYGRAQAKTDNPSWYKVYTEASKPTPAEIGAYTKAESDSRVNRIGNDTFLRNSNGSKWLALTDDGALSLYDNSVSKRTFFVSNTGSASIYGRGPAASYPALNFVKEDGYHTHIEASVHTNNHFLTFVYRDSKDANVHIINMPKKNGVLAIASEHYTKGEVDSRVNVKANSVDVWQKGQTYSRAESYSRSEVDSRVNVKANSADVYKKGETYSRSEVDSRVNVKANSADVYAKSAVYQKTETYNRSEIDSKVSVAGGDTANFYKTSHGNRVDKVGAGWWDSQEFTITFPSNPKPSIAFVDIYYDCTTNRPLSDIETPFIVTGGTSATLQDDSFVPNQVGSDSSKGGKRGWVYRCIDIPANSTCVVKYRARMKALNNGSSHYITFKLKGARLTTSDNYVTL